MRRVNPTTVGIGLGFVVMVPGLVGFSYTGVHLGFAHAGTLIFYEGLPVFEIALPVILMAAKKSSAALVVVWCLNIVNLLIVGAGAFGGF